ncbi:MAG: Hsp20/alpha crystallin family protein [Gammaproteobacteria bacterium]|nr:Hsp20/alpha crystallin family protein [Gammaproteobacteria bacterium]
MRVFRYDPWTLLEQFRNEINHLSDTQENGHGNSYVATSDWAPAVDIVEDNEAYVLLVDVPGVDPEKIDIQMENSVLSIKGERTSGQGQPESRKRAERPRGTFHRRFSLPDAADADRIAARCRNGVLEISIPKQQRIQARKIAVEG